MTVKMPHHTFNAAMQDGESEKMLNDCIANAKPEATYFLALDGLRTVIMIVNLESASGIPKLCEPWFLSFEADVEIQPVATPEDFEHADFAGIAAKWA